MAKGLVSSIEVHKEITIPLLFILGFLAIVLISGINEIENTFSFNTVSTTSEKFFSDIYVKIGFLSIFLYELIPSTFRLVTNAGFFIGLLDHGINPMVLVIIASIGRVFGYYLLYLLGRFIFRLFKKESRELAEGEHILHKHRMIIFFITPFLGILGEFIIIVAGHQRIGFLRIMPFLLLSNLLRNTIWLYVAIAQMNVGSG